MRHARLCQSFVAATMIVVLGAQTTAPLTTALADELGRWIK